ncbi:MAG: hypothetical protein A2X94_04780 [Bdellovibrionales bacterium GWB1_55_8]|nr:MAG: hypothetical protein A2X94_04780 [Bdellovibrionales bacterium GWB1_55_8]
MTGHDARGSALEAIFESMPDPVFVKDLDCRIVFCNRALAQLFGVSLPDDLRGKAAEDLFPAETAEKVYNDDRLVISSGRARTYEETISLPTGTTRTYITTKTPHRDASGRIIGLFGIARDVTDRKLAEDRLKSSEERFRGIFEQSPLSIQLLSREGRTLDVNEAFKKLWGADEDFMEFLLTRYNILEDAQLAAKGVTPYIRKALEGEYSVNPAVYYDAAEVSKGARARWVEGHFYPIRDNSGRVREVVLMHNDITDRKGAETALRESEAKQRMAREEAEKALHLRNEFLSVASHELKTPLTSLSMQIQMIYRMLEKNIEAAGKSDASLDKTLEILRRSQVQIKRFTTLINDLLDVAVISEGKLKLDIEDVDISALVADVIERFRLECEKSGCELKFERRRPSVAQVDRFRIEQVLVNLLSNALKYGPGRPIEIRVEMDLEQARISVQDQGVGIAEEDQRRIFARFERAVSSRNFGGLGLGLHIAHQIVLAHKGDIRVESELGRGSTFIVELPLVHGSK